MPGFMGLRGLELKEPREMPQRRGDTVRVDRAKRSREVVDKIVLEQAGNESTPNAAAKNSAAGNVAGRQISLTTMGEIMSGRVAVLTFDDTIMTAREIFSRIKFHHLPIVDENGGIIGVISDRDVLRNSSPFYGTINEQNRDKEIMGKKVGLIMSRNPLCVNPDTPVIEAVKLMNAKHISCLPIVSGDGCRLLGIATWKDVVRALCPAGFESSHDSSRLRIVETIKPVD